MPTFRLRLLGLELLFQVLDQQPGIINLYSQSSEVFLLHFTNPFLMLILLPHKLSKGSQCLVHLCLVCAALPLCHLVQLLFGFCRVETYCLKYGNKAQNLADEQAKISRRKLIEIGECRNVLCGLMRHHVVQMRRGHWIGCRTVGMSRRCM